MHRKFQPLLLQISYKSVLLFSMTNAHAPFKRLMNEITYVLSNMVVYINKLVVNNS